MTGQNVGYLRVSTVDQSTARQLDGVALDKIFEDKASGKDVKRPQLEACLAHLREGDTLHVHSMDRLCRNLDDLRRIVKDLTARGVIVRFHKEHLSFTGEDSPMSNLLLSMLGAVAEFERALIRERQLEGIAIAKATGAYKGRKPSLTAGKKAELVRRVASGENKTALAAEFRISRQTLYAALKPVSPGKMPTPPTPPAPPVDPLATLEKRIEVAELADREKARERNLKRASLKPKKIPRADLSVKSSAGRDAPATVADDGGTW